MRNSPVHTEAREGGEGGGAPGAEAEISPQPMVGTMITQIPLQPLEVPTLDKGKRVRQE